MTRFAIATAKRTFDSLRVRNYRLYFGGMLVSAIGTWMYSVAQGWLVLRLTGSGTLVGFVTAAQFVPMLLFGVWGGVIADRFDKRRTLLMTQTVMAVASAVLAAITLLGNVQVWMVFATALVLGFATVADNPTRQAFVTELVGADRVANAVALNSAMFNAARIVGPAIAGLLILAGGTGWVFLINAVSYLAVISSLKRMRTDELMPSARTARGPGQVRAGLRYAFSTPELRSVILLVAVVGTFALEFTVLMPVLARFTFNAGPGTLGALTSAMGIGSLVGALVTASRSRPTPGLLIGAAGALGVLMLGVAVAPTLEIALVVLALCGAATITFLSTANSTLQLRSDPEMRGRVMAFYAMVFLGSTPIGGPIVGAVAEHLGARAGFAVGGVAALIGAAVAGGVLLRTERVARRIDATATVGAPVPPEPAVV